MTGVIKNLFEGLLFSFAIVEVVATNHSTFCNQLIIYCNLISNVKTRMLLHFFLVPNRQSFFFKFFMWPDMLQHLERWLFISPSEQALLTLFAGRNFVFHFLTSFTSFFLIWGEKWEKLVKMRPKRKHAKRSKKKLTPC